MAAGRAAPVVLACVLALALSGLARATPTVEIELPGADRALLLFRDRAEVLATATPVALSPADRADLEAVWTWSNTCPVTRHEPGELGHHRCPERVSWLKVRVLWPGAPRTDLPEGALYAAPPAVWEDVPEPLLPTWTPDERGIARIPVVAGSGPLRIRFAGDRRASPWMDVDADRGSISVDLTRAHTPVVQVVGVDGQPASGAHISLFRPGTERDDFRAFLTSDEEGAVEPAGLPASSTVVAVVTAPGGLPVRFETLVQYFPSEVRLSPGCTVTGRVEDLDDQPIPGVTVHAEGYTGGGDGVLLQATARVEEDGRFRIGPLPLGPAVIVMEDPGFGRRLDPVNLADCDDGRWDMGTVKLSRARRLELLLFDDLGRPAPDVEVRTTSGEVVTTDADGQAELGQISEGEGVGLEIDGRGYLSLKRTVTPPIPQTLAIELQRSATVRGRIVDYRGRPVPEASIRLERGNHFREEEASADGSFELELRPGAAHDLRFRSPSTLDATRRVEPMSPGSELDLADIELPRGWTVTGRLLRNDTAEPVGGARVWSLRNEGLGGPLVAWAFESRLSAVSEPDGTFRLTGLALAPTTIRVEDPTLAPLEVDVSPGEEGSADLDLGDLYLSSGATVHVTGSSTESALARLDWKREWREMDMVTAPFLSGEAWLRHVPPGPGIVTVVRRGRQLCEAAVRVPNQGTIDVDCAETDLEVTGSVRRGGVPDGPGTLRWFSDTMGDTLVMNRRSALGATAVQVLGAGRPQVDVPVAADGRFETSALAAGSWTVAWHPDGGGSTRGRDVELPEKGEIELTLDFAPLQVTGVVVDGSGEPVAGARVVDLEGRVATRSDDEGYFHLLDLDVGTHRLQALHRSLSSPVETVEILPDRAPDLIVLTLDRPSRQTLQIHVETDSGSLDHGFAFVETTGGRTRIVSLDAGGSGEIELARPTPASLRVAALQGNHWIFGQWQETRAALDEGVDLTAGGGGVLEVTGGDGELAVEVLAPGGWNLSALYRHLGTRLVVPPDRPLQISGLPPGRYELQAGAVARFADLGEDDTAEVRFDGLDPSEQIP